MKSQLFGAVCTVLLTVTTLSAHAEFFGRLETSPGSGVFQAYYNDQLDITLTADANINGPDSWDDQMAWAADLDIDGVTGWRLPSADANGDTTVIDCSGGGVSGCADNELGFLFWEEGINSDTPDPFNNVQSGYWSGTELENPSFAWLLLFDDSIQGGNLKDLDSFAWAVHSGDVAVPIPAAAWLMGTGLIGLLGLAKRQRRRLALR